MTLVFASGSPNGTMMCANVAVLNDSMVECDEEFSVELSFDAAKDNLILANNTTSVMLMDSDGMSKRAYCITYNLTSLSQLLSSQYQIWKWYQKVTAL